MSSIQAQTDLNQCDFLFKCVFCDMLQWKSILHYPAVLLVSVNLLKNVNIAVFYFLPSKLCCITEAEGKWRKTTGNSAEKLETDERLGAQKDRPGPSLCVLHMI
ncbi:hypothetical protein GOODEAATRI_018179 [Goodea atripinnis]|uniref:Uncharacterized protein n=1 Tax=Goodea atripinnis TaxID=208336 RepID=A0ABV0PYZ2_9TELE